MVDGWSTTGQLTGRLATLLATLTGRLPFSKPYPRSPKPLIYIETTPPPSRPLNWSIGGRWVVDYWPVNWSTGHPPVHFPST